MRNTKTNGLTPKLKHIAPLLLFLTAACPSENAKTANAPDPEKILNSTAGRTQQQTAARKQGGLMLDSARHFYSVEVIKDFIDTLAKSGGSFLHLHFSDDENYALESNILNQRAADAERGAGGIYTNPVTGKPFLSFEQLNEIKAYAQSKNIELIPEIGSPSHMGGIFKLLEHNRGADYVKSIRSRHSDELDITNPKSIEFIKSLISEAADAFRGNSRHFHIGGDEFGYSVDNNHEFITYANNLAGYLRNRGLQTRMWNDGLINATVDRLDRNIQITYWSYDGDVQNKQDARYRREIRSSMPDLLDKGFGVLNYNSYYLYINPKRAWSTSHDSDFATRDVLNRWNLGVWDGENRSNAVKDTSRIMGAAMAIWGENAENMSSKTIQKYTSGLLESIIRKTVHTQSSDNDDLLMQNLAVLTNGPLKRSYLDWELVQDDEAVNLTDNGTESLHLLQENVLEKRKNLNVWVRGSERNKIMLGSNWQKTADTRRKGGVDYQAYRFMDNTLWIDTRVPVGSAANGT